MAAAACGKSETATTTFRFTSSSQPGTSVRPARRTPSRQSVAITPFFILACSISRTPIPLSHRIAAQATSTTQEARRHHREEGKSSAVGEATRGESLSDPLPSSERSEPNRTGQRHPRSRSLLVWFRRSPSLAPSVSVSIHLRARAGRCIVGRFQLLTSPTQMGSGRGSKNGIGKVKLDRISDRERDKRTRSGFLGPVTLPHQNTLPSEGKGKRCETRLPRQRFLTPPPLPIAIPPFLK